MESIQAVIEAFLEGWQEGPEGNKRGFIRLRDSIRGLDGVRLEFHQREGVTSSLRGLHHQGKSPLFVMVDVIEDQPRWLSICFYAAMVSDPEERGAFVPGGLLGEDALCFDLESAEEEPLRYVENRIKEAWQASAVGV